MTLIAVRTERLPTNIPYGLVGGPSFQTERVITGGGFAKKNARWKNPLRKFQLDVANFSADDYADWLDFYQAVAFGGLYNFLVKDFTDFEAAGEATSPAVGDGSNRIFQLAKTYARGPYSLVRLIQKPNDDVTPVVYVSGTAVSPSNYTLDLSTGLLTFNSGHAPANAAPVAADFNFDVPCEFDDDYLPGTVENPVQTTVRGVNITEVRLS